MKNIFELIPKKNGKILTYNPFKLIPLLLDSYRFGLIYKSDLSYLHRCFGNQCVYPENGINFLPATDLDSW